MCTEIALDGASLVALMKKIKYPLKVGSQP
jgi:hypothetical protein